MMFDHLDEPIPLAPSAIQPLRHRRIQMMLAFRRWDREWGMYPAQWEIDDVTSDVKTYEMPKARQT
jgi:hypothetical protein